MTYDQLQAMPYNDLRELYSKVCDVLKTKRELKAKEVSRTITAGMVVQFAGRKSEGEYKVLRVNRTTASCTHIGTGQSWKLPLSGVLIVN